jgi:lipopolysaccharide/colanic/teichoic acid biosynthesis glycosyltransferase
MTNASRSQHDPLQGTYARRLRPLLSYSASVALFGLALPVGLGVAAINGVLFGGPRRIFFTQERRGLHGRPFKILKFRTMRDLGPGQVSTPGSEADARRVTRFGRFLRSTHLDELPQLFNVLRGDMALIGPRPEMSSIEQWAQECIPGFGERLNMRPGLTGYAQIIQGYTPQRISSYERKLALHKEYLQNLSFSMDLLILWRTVLWVAGGRGWDYKRFELELHPPQQPASSQGEGVVRVLDPGDSLEDLITARSASGSGAEVD